MLATQQTQPHVRPQSRAHSRTHSSRTAAPVIPSAVLQLDCMLYRLAAARDRLALPLAHAARLFHDARGWTPFGFSQAGDWTHEHLGRSASWLRRLAAVDRAVEKHSALAAALTGADGGLPLGTAALLDIANACASQDDGVVQHWIDRARRVSLRELRLELSSALDRKNDAPVADPAITSSHASGPHPSGVSEAAPVASVEEYQLTLVAPPDVHAAFEEALDLHRAVAGRETGLVEFVDALCAEGASGPFPFDVETKPLRRRSGAAAVPQPLDLRHLDAGQRSISALELLGHGSNGTSALRRAASVLRRFADLERTLPAAPPAGACQVRRLAAHLAELVQIECTLDIRIGELLAELDTERPWKLLRFTSAAHYAEERLHMNRTTARDRMDAARGLHRLPVVEQAYESGRIGIEKALLVLRLAKLAPIDARTQAEWVHRLEHATLKRCRDEYRALRRQHALHRSDPTGPHRAPGAEFTHPGSASLPLADTTWHDSIRRTPGATRDFVLEVGCRVLDRAHAGRFTPLASRRLRLPDDSAHVFAASVDAARRALVAAASAPTSPGAEARLRPSVRIARLFAGKPAGVPAWLGLLGLLEEYVLVWDSPEAMPDRRRDAIHERDGYRCTSPGCTQRQTLEAHHLRYRSQGGADAPDNLITLCAFHHRLGEHGMLATCSGRAPLDVVWGLGASDLRAWYRNEIRLERPAGARSA